MSQFNDELQHAAYKLNDYAQDEALNSTVTIEFTLRCMGSLRTWICSFFTHSFSKVWEHISSETCGNRKNKLWSEKSEEKPFFLRIFWKYDNFPPKWNILSIFNNEYTVEYIYSSKYILRKAGYVVENVVNFFRLVMVSVRGRMACRLGSECFSCQKTTNPAECEEKSVKEI